MDTPYRDRKFEDLTGRQYGDWRVLGYGGRANSARVIVWDCVCVCGVKRAVRGPHLRSGASTGCGCSADKRFSKTMTKHGLSPRGDKSPELTAWNGMKSRCYNSKNKAYKNYGGRGIYVCDEWRDDFARFAKDMGDRPSSDHSIDRIDNDGPYSPDNCQWTTRYHQNRNHRRNHMITFNGETKCITDWAKTLGIRQNTLHYRLKKWPLERALTEGANKQF